MLKKINLVPTTSKSHPFATAVNKNDFKKKGYLEDEYFIYGTANIYEEEKESFKTIYKDVDYCNRILVRRPENKDSFSGNVIVEILNPTAMMDLDRMWVISGKHFMRRGDIYVGITSKPDVLAALMAFDEERYKEINWRFPFERKAVPVQENEVSAMPPPRPDCETGLFWDMLTDLALLLRGNTDQNPIRDYKINKISLTGWSQSACYLWTYVNRLALNTDYNKGRTLFDGYFAAGGVYMLAVPLNQSGYSDGSTRQYRKFTYMPVPYISVQTESENAMFDGHECYQPDSDTAELKYRVYEIAGSTHDNKQTLIDYYLGDKDVEKIAMTPRYMGENELPNDFPYHFNFNALYEQFFDWVNTGEKPINSIMMDSDSHGKTITDKFGNATGGIRSPFIDVPVCTYVPYSDFKGGKFPLFGHVVPFSASKLTEIYKDIVSYEKLVEAAANESIVKGHLLKIDRDEIVYTAVENAKKYWK